MIIYFLIILGHAPKNDVGKAGNITGGQTMPYTVRVVALNEHHTCTFSRVRVEESEILQLFPDQTFKFSIAKT